MKTQPVDRKIALARSALVAIPALCMCALSMAHEASSREETELLELKSDVQQLQAQQQKLLEGMDEIRKIVGRSNDAVPRLTLPQTMSLAGESFRGESTAKLVVLEYADFECRFCRHFEQSTWPKLRDTYISTGQMRYYFRDMPLPIHSLAMPAARTAHCAADQGQFWPMHDSLFAGGLLASSDDIHERAVKLGLDVPKLDACLASNRFVADIQRSTQQATDMGIRGTPTFLIGIAGPGPDEVTIKRTIVGAEDFDAFKSALDPLLAPSETPRTVAKADTAPPPSATIVQKQ